MMAPNPILPPSHGLCALTGCVYVHVRSVRAWVSWPIPVEDGCVVLPIKGYLGGQTWGGGIGGGSAKEHWSHPSSHS